MIALYTLAALLIVMGLLAIAAGVEFWIDERRARGLPIVPTWLRLAIAGPFSTWAILIVLLAMAFAPLRLAVVSDEPLWLLLWIPLGLLGLVVAAAA